MNNNNNNKLVLNCSVLQRTTRNIHHLAWSWKDLHLRQILHRNLERCLKNYLIFSFLEKARFVGRSGAFVRPASISGRRGQTFQLHKLFWRPDTGDRDFKAMFCSRKWLWAGIRHVSVRPPTGADRWLSWNCGYVSKEERKTITISSSWGRDKWIIPLTTSLMGPDYFLNYSVIYIQFLSYFLQGSFQF